MRVERMEKSKLSQTQQAIVEELYKAFIDRDYPECVSQVVALGMASGYRVFTPILSQGINFFEIDREPSFQAALIFTIANLRLGRQTDGEAAFMLNAVAGGEIRNWLMNMLALSLRRAEFKEVIAYARDQTEVYQAHYYEAEGLVTDRAFDSALVLFQHCLELSGKCPERNFVPSRVKWLELRVTSAWW